MTEFLQFQKRSNINYKPEWQISNLLIEVGAYNRLINNVTKTDIAFARKWNNATFNKQWNARRICPPGLNKPCCPSCAHGLPCEGSPHSSCKQKKQSPQTRAPQGKSCCTSCLKGAPCEDKTLQHAQKLTKKSHLLKSSQQKPLKACCQSCAEGGPCEGSKPSTSSTILSAEDQQAAIQEYLHQIDHLPGQPLSKYEIDAQLAHFTDWTITNLNTKVLRKWFVCQDAPTALEKVKILVAAYPCLDSTMNIYLYDKSIRIDVRRTNNGQLNMKDIAAILLVEALIEE